MKELRKKNLVICCFIMAAMFINLFVTFTIVKAAEQKDFIQLNTDIPLTDNLVALKGREVTIWMTSGQTMTGIVKVVQNDHVHLERLNQKEYYDALIRLDRIIAIEVRAR